MKRPDPIVIDFETKEIERRPNYPPEPVGVGIWLPGSKPRYYGFGHLTGKPNCTEAEAKQAYVAAIRTGEPILMHNAPFDIEVGEAWCGEAPSWRKVFDTQNLGFFADPDRKRLKLDHLAIDILGLKESPKNAMRDWIVAHVKGVTRTSKNWGAHIWRAPTDLAERYCVGDLRMTRRLFPPLWRTVVNGHAMLPCIEIEQDLAPMLLEMEREGVPIAVSRLARDLRLWESWWERVDVWVRRRLHAPSSLDIDSSAQLADAFESAGVIEEWIMTEPSKTYPEGQRSTSISALSEVLKDRALLDVLKFRARLVNSITHFGRPWLEMARENDGAVSCRWNSIARSDPTRTYGARTGRASSNPNLQNVPKKPLPIRFGRRRADAAGLVLPTAMKDMALPHPRDYIVPGRNGELIGGDYSQQELRILAHFAGGKILQDYQENPRLDIHEHAGDLIYAATSRRWERRAVKDTGFGVIYGQSLGALAEKIGTTWEEARSLRRDYKRALGGIEDLERELRRRAQRRQPIFTWGGRAYYCEEPKLVRGRMRTFEYKMMNTLIQGSAADCLKRGMLNYYHHPKRRGRLLIQVHDELLAHCPKSAWREEVKVLREAMESVEFKVEMLADMKHGRTWARMKEVSKG